GERHAVMRGKEVDGARPLTRKHIRRARQSCRQRRYHAMVAAPEPADVIAIAVVPLEEFWREAPELVSARANVPWFGDQHPAADFGISNHCLEHRRVRVKAEPRTPQYGRKIEAKAVDARIADKCPQRLQYQPLRCRMLAIERVA